MKKGIPGGSLGSFDVYVSRYRLLESRLEETVQQTMKVKEEKISCLEKKVEESNALNATLLTELATVRLHVCRQEMHSDLSLFHKVPSTGKGLQ